MKRHKKYNIQNLKPFTKENASYYGHRGGRASGKQRLLKRIDIIRFDIGFIQIDLEHYRGRKRLYNKEIKDIKEQLHHIKIYQNRLKKLIKKLDENYD